MPNTAEMHQREMQDIKHFAGNASFLPRFQSPKFHLSEIISYLLPENTQLQTFVLFSLC